MSELVSALGVCMRAAIVFFVSASCRNVEDGGRTSSSSSAGMWTSGWKVNG